ncbi:MAG: DUF2393 family protein [Clostridia bacterium]|nr:DUF2393 family protein [Clostridia bacterium]
MKTKNIITFCILLTISSFSLCCVEYTNQLSSDFTPIKSHTLSVINDSNLVVFHICEKESAYIDSEKFTVKGNITNIGSNTIQACTVNASFFNRMKNSPSFNNDVESRDFWNIEPNQTVNFTIENKYNSRYIKYYKINVIY